MDSIDIIKPLSTVQSSPANKSWEYREANPGPLGAKRERDPLCYALPSYPPAYLILCLKDQLNVFTHWQPEASHRHQDGRRVRVLQPVRVHQDRRVLRRLHLPHAAQDRLRRKTGLAHVPCKTCRDWFTSNRDNGVIDGILACGADGPGLIPAIGKTSAIQKVFLPLGIRW